LGMEAQPRPGFGEFIQWSHGLARLDVLSPLLLKIRIFPVLFGLAVAWRAWRRPSLEQKTGSLWLLAAFLLVNAVAAATAGVKQPVSFFRYTSFCLPVMIGLTACAWLYIAAPIRIRWLNDALRYLLPLILLISALWQFYTQQKPALRQVIPNALAFADGSFSIRQAYGNQQGWAMRHEWGGIFPGVVGAWRTAGPGTRIWSMHLGAYCMLPHCRSETCISFTLSPHFLDMLVLPGDETRAILQREGLNYFFFTTAMDVDDYLPLLKPFAPDQIANYIGIKWTDGTSFLLTWLGSGVIPLTPEWVAQYKKAVETAPWHPVDFPLALMLNVREQLRRNPHWGSDLVLPGLR